MTCKGNTSACDGRDLLPVRMGISHDVRLMCAACREKATEIGAYVWVVERRVVDVPVEVNRRHAKPRWLQRLTAREDASWRAA